MKESESIASLTRIVKIEPGGEKKYHNTGNEDEPDRKKARGFTLEEYEAMLDQDTTFDDVDLNFGDTG